jgi:hypothetical protein
MNNDGIAVKTVPVELDAKCITEKWVPFKYLKIMSVIVISNGIEIIISNCQIVRVDALSECLISLGASIKKTPIKLPIRHIISIY